MTKLTILLSFFVSILLLSSQSQSAVVIKLATVAPRDSIWHNHLKTIDQRWQEVSNGEVRLKVYAGTLGDEDDILRRVRIRQLDAATISTGGLSAIDRSTLAMHIPLAFVSNEEMEFVRDGVAKSVEPLLAQKGFRVLAWGEVGWVHFFTSNAVITPEDLRKQSLFQWANGDSSAGERLWQDMGFETVSLSSVDILPALQTGMITAFQSPPLAALANQWFPFTPYMTDLKWAPLIGATIITEQAWQKIPEIYHQDFKNIVFEESLILQQQVRDLERQAIDAMKKRGLTIVKLSEKDKQKWVNTVEKIYPLLRETLMPAEYFDQAIALRDSYRSQESKPIIAQNQQEE